MDYVAADESEYVAVLICVLSVAWGWPNIWDEKYFLTQLTAKLPENELLGKGNWIETDGELLASLLMVTMALGLRDSMGYVKKAVTGDKLTDWCSEAMLNATRDLLPYFAYLIAMVAWAKTVLDPLSDHNTQLFFMLGTSAAFSRMCLELIHDTLTKLPVPIIFIEMVLPILGTYVANNQPEYNKEFIQCADCQCRSSVSCTSLTLSHLCCRFGCGLVWPVRNQDRRHRSVLRASCWRKSHFAP